MKQCSKCKEWKDESEFRKHIHHSDGLSSLCKSCKSEYDRAYRKKNKNKLKKQNKEYRKNNKAKVANKKREYCKKNKEKIANQRKEYRKNNKEHIIKQEKKYRKNNKKKIAKRDKKYYKNNKEKINIYYKNKYKTSINFKLAQNLRERIRKALFKNSKSAPTIKLLGCSIEKCKEHLESQFKKGMTWKNHGTHGWHIDHIRPCVSFDLSIPEQQKICFHYTNLQPLWARDNLKKGAKWNKNI